VAVSTDCFDTPIVVTGSVKIREHVCQRCRISCDVSFENASYRAECMGSAVRWIPCISRVPGSCPSGESSVTSIQTETHMRK
jgi:hypothetical protein